MEQLREAVETLLAKLPPPPTFIRERSRWPNPRESIGPIQYRSLGKHRHCWQAVGPAQDSLVDVCERISNIILSNGVGYLDSGEETSFPISVELYMVGRREERAQPIIIIRCSSASVRKKALRLIKESRILAEPNLNLESVLLGSLPRSPRPLAALEAADMEEIGDRPVFTRRQITNPCGALIFITSGKTPSFRKATMGGVVIIDGTYYGMTARHASAETFSFDSGPPGGNIEVTIEEGLDSSSGNTDGNSSVSSGNIPDPQGSANLGNGPSASGANTEALPDLVGLGTKLGPGWRNDELDWELFKIDNGDYKVPNKLPPPYQDVSPRWSSSVRPVDQNILAITGTNGVIRGRISGTPFFLRMPGRERFQKTWVVSLERETTLGDCGSWVVDSASGDIYGHIIAGDGDMAYIVPLPQMSDDMAKLGRIIVSTTDSAPSPSHPPLNISSVGESVATGGAAAAVGSGAQDDSMSTVIKAPRPLLVSGSENTAPDADIGPAYIIPMIRLQAPEILTSPPTRADSPFQRYRLSATSINPPETESDKPQASSALPVSYEPGPIEQDQGVEMDASTSGGGIDTVEPEDNSKTELRMVLKERHVNMIAFSTCVGIGLFLQCGRVISLVGPLLAMFVYLISGGIIWCAIASLGEMTALFPVKGGLFVFPRRFLDAGVGYAAGWMSWLAAVVVVASEVLAVAQLFRFEFEPKYLEDVGYPEAMLGWQFGQHISQAIWALAFLMIMLLVNCLPVIWYGRLAYLVGIIKMLFVVGLIFFNVIVNIRSSPIHPPYGRTWTYNTPHSPVSRSFTINKKRVTGSTATFLAFWTAMTNVVFSMIAFMSVSITIPESKDLRRTETIKMSTRKILLRIILLYTLSCLVVGFNVPHTDPNLQGDLSHSISSGQDSVFVLAAVHNRIRFWPSFFNGFFIFSAMSAGINWLYISSRVLHALADNGGAWPDYYFFYSLRARLQRTHLGVPYNAIFASWLFGLFGFLSTGSQASAVLNGMAKNASVSMLIVYAVICLSYLQFFKCIDRAALGQTGDLQIQDLVVYNRTSGYYPYRSRGQKLKALTGLIGCILLVIFNGWHSFIRPFNRGTFAASYISPALFVVISMVYHVSSDGWNPRKWRRHTMYDLKYPPPIVVLDSERVARLGEVDVHNVFSRQNAVTFGSWIWAWLK